MHSAKRKASEFRKAVGSYFRETTVHGFRYVVEGENIYEKIFWVMVIIVGFICSGYIITASFQEWGETPLQTTVDKVSMPIEELAQPAITVCHPPELQMPRRNRWMYMEKVLNWIDKSQGKYIMSLKINLASALNTTFSLYVIYS